MLGYLCENHKKAIRLFVDRRLRFGETVKFCQKTLVFFLDFPIYLRLICLPNATCLFNRGRYFSFSTVRYGLSDS
jgi:hypothetical protein